MKVSDFTNVLGRFGKAYKAPNEQSKNELLSPNIEKVGVSQRLVVGYRDCVLVKGWI